MAGTGKFQLFPAPPGKSKNTRNLAPTNEKRALVPRLLSPVPLENPKSSSNTEALLVQIIEDTKAIQREFQTSVPIMHGPSISKPIENNQSAGSNGYEADSPIPHSMQSSSPDSVSVNTATPQQTGSSQSSTPAPFESPVIAMKSMFPRYNHNRPLSQQEYYPQTTDPSALPRQKAYYDAEKPTSRGWVESDVAFAPKTAPASILEFPGDALSPQEVRYPSSEELEILWEAANGQKLPHSLKTFGLQMTRTDLATFTFGNPQLPFYTMQTFSTSEIRIMRTHPRKPGSRIHVMTLKLEDWDRRRPPNDGLVTVIFSKLAAMLAADQAAELTRKHFLAPTEAVEVETNAVKRAAAQESCRLIWNSRESRYELQHPSLLKQHTPSIPSEDGNPLSRIQTQDPGILHIMVYKPSVAHSGHLHQPPTILVTRPLHPNDLEAVNSAATPRTSTLPLTDNDEVLASLDLSTMSLSISAGMISATIPSLYAIDSLIAAILAVAVSDVATNSTLSGMEFCASHDTPSPRLIYGRNSIATTVQTPRFTGRLVTTIAEREDAEEESKLMSQLKSSDSNHKEAGTKRPFFGFWGRSKSKTKQIVIDEIDLERYGRYGEGSSRAGQKLPSLIRVILHLMVWGLEFVVGFLSLGVKFLAWLLVNVTRCVTSDKF